MKSIVIYFSMSGNTKKIAQQIRAGISNTGERCDIARLRDLNTEDLADYRLIGLGSPILTGKEPSVVSRFIEETMRSVDGKLAFTFSTHGAIPGYYFARVIPALIQRGLTVISWNDWFCDVVYPVTPSPYFIAGHPDEIDLKEAEQFGREMVERARRISDGETELIPVLARGKAYDDIYVPVEVPPSRTYPGEFEKFAKAISD